MRIPRALGLTVASASVVLGAPLPAFADPATTLYVNNTSGANCSDTGTGTQAQPFCTISKAAQVVEAGQTVEVRGVGYNESVSLTRSGTPDKPISFVGIPHGDREFDIPSVYGSNPLTITGAHDVVVSGFHIYVAFGPSVVTDSQRITLDRNHIDGHNPDTIRPSLQVRGQSDHVTVSRNRFVATATGGVTAEAGTHDITVTTNDFFAPSSGISATDSPTFVATNNTLVNACGPGIALNGASTKSSVQNNILVSNPSSRSVPLGILCGPSLPKPVPVTVAAGSTDGTTVDYNVVNPVDVAYNWAGTTYDTPAAFAAATGQGRHDTSQKVSYEGTALDLMPTDDDVAVIDTANPDAPGVLPTDVNGTPAMHDPLLPAGVGNSTGKDRGAREVQGLKWANLNVSGVDGTHPQGAAPLTVELRPSVKNTWPTTLTYTYDFQDGTPPVTTTDPMVRHTYAAVGQYSPRVTVQDSLGARVSGASATNAVWVQDAGPLSPSIDAVNQTGRALEYGFQAHADSPWYIRSLMIDPGDGSAPFTPGGSPHTYPRPGTYTVTLTATDESGRTATTSKTIDVDYPVATKDLYVGERVDVITDIRQGWSPYPNVPNMTEARANYTSGTWRPWAEIPMSAAYAALQDTRIAAAYTADGNVHLISAQYWRLQTADWNGRDQKWSTLQDLPNNPFDGAYATQLAVAAMGEKLHVLTVVNGRVYQNTGDYAAGRWSGWHDVTAAAGIGTPITKIAAAGTGNQLHIAMVDAQGQVRVAEGDYDRGTWWSGALPAQLGNPWGTTQLAAAVVGGKFHVLALAGGNVYQATADYAAGSWGGWYDLSPATGLTGGVEQLAATGTGNSLRLYAISGGHVYNATGDYAKGAWYPWADVTASGAAGPSAPVSKLTVAGIG